MNIALVINEGPFTHQASDSALHYAVAAIKRGHNISRVFFYHDGINNANLHAEPQSDDRNLPKLWSQLSQQHDVDLVVCIAAALRRGITEDHLPPGFRISGLGQLIEAGITSDRLIVFGD